MCASGETNLPTFSVEQPLYVKWLAPGISAQSIITKVRILIPVTLFLTIFFYLLVALLYAVIIFVIFTYVGSYSNYTSGLFTLNWMGLLRLYIP